MVEIKLVKRNEDEYAVFLKRDNLVNGDLIGVVGKGWFRNCGKGWARTGRNHWGFKTRREAIADLLKNIQA